MNKKSTIIVTGGMGFIGYEIAKKYSEEGNRVFVIDNCSNTKKEKNPQGFDLISCDLRNLEEVSSIINSVKPDVISHHAAHIDVTNSIQNSVFDAENNIIATLNILNTLKKHKVKKFIFSSSGGAVYNSSEKEPFSEYTELKPDNPYGIAKMACENYIRFFSKEYGFPAITLRYSNVYGLGQINNKYQGVIIKFLKKILDDEMIEINGDGTQSRDFVYINDVVQANTLALNYSNGSDIFNIGSNEKSSILEIVDLISQAVKKTPTVKFKKASPGVASSLLDINRAQEKLGYIPTFTIKSGIQDLIKNYHSSLITAA